MADVQQVKWNAPPGMCAVKHPITELTVETELFVDEDQEVFVSINGDMQGPIPPGNRKLNAENLPFLAEALTGSLDEEPTFMAELWFVNRANPVDVKWGTRESMLFMDPVYNVKLPVRAFGRFRCQISDSGKFLRSMVETVPAFHEEQLSTHLKSVVLNRVQGSIETCLLAEGKSVLDIGSELRGIQNNLQTQVSEELESSGLELTQFELLSISTDETHPEVRVRREAMLERARIEIMGPNYTPAVPLHSIPEPGSPGSVDLRSIITLVVGVGVMVMLGINTMALYRIEDRLTQTGPSAADTFNKPVRANRSRPEPASRSRSESTSEVDRIPVVANPLEANGEGSAVQASMAQALDEIEPESRQDALADILADRRQRAQNFCVENEIDTDTTEQVLTALGDFIQEWAELDAVVEEDLVAAAVTVKREAAEQRLETTLTTLLGEERAFSFSEHLWGEP